MRKVQSDKNFAKAGIREKEEINFKGNGNKLLNFINGEIKQFLICDLYGEIERLFSISKASKLLLGKNIYISRLVEHIFELINKNTANKSLLNTFKHLFIIQIFFYKSAEKG